MLACVCVCVLVCEYTVLWSPSGQHFVAALIEGGCITEVHNTLVICTMGPNKVALLERLAAIE